MSEKLKTYCPFCGGVDFEIIKNKGFYRVSCLSCASAGSPEETKNQALKSWNKRYKVFFPEL